MEFENTVSDGFGNHWAKCELKDLCGLHVVRVGKVQCNCDNEKYSSCNISSGKLLYMIEELNLKVNDLENKVYGEKEV